MRKCASLLLVCLLALTASCSREQQAPAPPAPVAQDAGEIMPRPVLQVGNSAPIEAVAWVNGSDNLVSIDSLGGIVVWDVANRLVLDHAQVPQLNEYLILWEMKPQEDPRRLSVIYAIDEPHEDLRISNAQLCPAGALHDTPWCTFTLDLETREVIPDASIPVPERPWIEMGDVPPGLPLSPDGAWRPEPRRTVEVGDPSRPIQHIAEEGQNPGIDCASTRRCDYMIVLHPVSGEAEEIHLRGQQRLYSTDTQLSGDGTRLAKVYTVKTWPTSRTLIDTLDLTTGSTTLWWDAEDGTEYHRAAFAEDGSLLLLGRGHNRYAGDLYEGALPTSALRSIEPDEEDDPWAEQADAFAALDSRTVAPARVIDRDCLAANACPSAASYYAMEMLDTRGDYIGAGNLAGCLMELGEFYCEDRESIMADGISRFSAATGRWQRMEQPDWGDEDIAALRLSPARDRLAVLTGEGSPFGPGESRTLRLRIFAIDGNRLVASDPPLFEHRYTIGEDYGYFFIDQGNSIEAEELLSFTPDGEHVIVSHFLHAGLAESDSGYEMVVVKADGSAPANRFAGHSRTLVPFGTDSVFEVEAGTITDLETGERMATVGDKPTLLSAGWIASGNLLWGAGADGRILFWDGDSGALELTIYLQPGSGFFAMTPGGRYDTNLGPDASAVRWTVADDPWRSLAPQTFMRDFFEPGLVGKLLACRAADTCDTTFRRLPAFERVKRVLPEVRIVSVDQGEDARTARVTVEVREGTGPDGEPDGGLYNLRLFRNGRLVAMTPERPERMQAASQSWQDNVGLWREDNVLRPRDGVYQHTFTVPMPWIEQAGTQRFSAYAFNEDRIKSDTAEYRVDYWDYPFRFTPPDDWFRRNAYIINIGINAYDREEFRLNYAASDARLLARRLAEGEGADRSFPEYEVHQLTLVADDEDPRSPPQGITRQTILDVLRLVGGQGDRDAILKRLDDQNIDASMLQEATPSDLVVVTFSDHGWADPLGNFHLVPSNGDIAEPRRLVSAADLSDVLRTNQAGEIALILDACFSSAIVESGGFRPGPMGDAGLGQLAYDKGLFILAASQADSLAIENPRLRQGLLTYALAGPDEGLDMRPAPENGRQRDLELEDWLTYAVARLPQLGDVRGIGRYNPSSRSMTPLAPGVQQIPEGYIQRPSLFNFNAKPVGVTVKW